MAEFICSRTHHFFHCKTTEEKVLRKGEHTMWMYNINCYIILYYCLYLHKILAMIFVLQHKKLLYFSCNYKCNWLNYFLTWNISKKKLINFYSKCVNVLSDIEIECGLAVVWALAINKINYQWYYNFYKSRQQFCKFSLYNNTI